MHPITVAIVEDESLFRHLLASTLAQKQDLQIIGCYGNAREALTHIPRLKPDVVLLDIQLDDNDSETRPMNGIELGIALRERLPRLGIVLLSNHCEPEFLTSLPPDTVAGWSYLLKSSVEHVDSLWRTIRGSRDGLVVVDPRLIAYIQGADSPVGRLTPRQRQILDLVASGRTNNAIARELLLSEKTIQNQINLIYDKLDIDRRDPDLQPRVQAVLTYLQHQ